MRSPGFIKRWFRRFVVVAVVVFCLIVLAGAFIQTPPGKQALARLVSSVVSRYTDLDLTISTLSGTLPHRLRVEGIHVAGPQGDFVTIEDLHLQLSLSALLRGTLHITHLSMAHLQLWRRPPPQERFRLPRIPQLPTWPTLDLLRIDRLTLEEEVLGTRTALAVSGRLSPAEGWIWPEAHFHIEGLDIEGTRASLTYSYADGAPRLQLTAEDTSLLPEMLDMAAPVELRVEGSGPREDWHATLELKAGESVVVEGALQLLEDEHTALDLELRVQADQAPVLRDQVHLLGPLVETRLSAVLDRDGALEIATAAITSERLALTLGGTVQFEVAHADIEADVNHTDIGRVLTMLHSEGPTPGRLRLTAQGAFDALDLTMNATVDEAPLAQGVMALVLEEGVALSGQMQVYPLPMMRDAFPHVPEEGATIAFEVSYSEETGAVELARLDIDGAGVLLNAQGRFLPETPAFEATVTLDATDIRMAAQVFDIPMTGAAQVAFDADGNGDGLSLSLHAALTDMEFAALRLSDAVVELTGSCSQWDDFAPEAVEAALSARAHGLQIPELKPMDLAATATLKAATLDDIQVSAFSLTDGNARVSGVGQILRAPWRGNLAVDVAVAALEALPFTVEGLPQGRGRARLKGEGALAPLALALELEGAIEDIAEAPEPVAALTGDAVAFNAAATVHDMNVSLTALEILGNAFTVTGTGDYAHDTAAVEAAITTTLPDISVVGAALEHAVQGAVTIQTDISGALPALTLTAIMDGEHLRYETWPAAQAHLRIEGAYQPGGPSATVTGHIDAGGERLVLDGRVEQQEERINIAPITLNVGNNRIAGSAAYPLDDAKPEATVTVDLPELDALAAMVGVVLTGSAHAALTLADDTVHVVAEANTLHHDAVSLDKVEATVVMEHLWTSPTGQASAVVTALHADPARVDQLRAEAWGDLETIKIQATVAGAVDTGLPETQPVNGTFESSVFITEQQFVLQKTDGHLGDVPYRIETPVTVSFPDKTITVPPVALHIGDGRITVEGGQAPGAVYAHMDIRALPLSLSKLVTDPGVDGRLDGTITLGGTFEAPELVVEMAVTEARLDLDTAEGFSPLSAHVSASARNNRIDATLEATMDSVLQFDATASTPLTWQLQPWALALPGEEAVSGAVAMEITFMPVLQALGLVEHQLDAQLTGALHLNGTIDAPEMTGQAHIRDGRYENAVTGTLLRDITLLARADGLRVQLVKCSARTHDRGALSATGELQLLPEQQFPFKFEAALDDAQPAKLDYLNGRINGGITAEGTLAGALVSGELTITPVNISMPDQLPATTPTTLEVIEIKDGEISEPPEIGPMGLASQVQLDIVCIIPGRVYVRAPVLDSEWSGRLHVTGSLAEPNVEGRLAVLRGHLDFLSRRFLLRDSAIVFQGGPPTAPWLDMRAITQTPALNAQLSLTGDLHDIALALSSEPSLPQDEILAQILFGRDLSQISPIQAIQLARIATMFNRRMSGLPLLSGQIGLPGIDRLDIRTGEEADDTVVGMGRYFTDSVYVEVEQGTTSDSGKISVEVEVSPRISVKGDVDAQDRSGVGLFWRRDY